MAFAARERTKPYKEQQDAERDRLEAALEAGLEGTFPASDAIKKKPRQCMLGVSSESLPQLRLLSRAAGVSGDGLAALPAY